MHVSRQSVKPFITDLAAPEGIALNIKDGDHNSLRLSYKL